MDLPTAAPRPYAALLGVERSLEGDVRLLDLLRLRASQINGCAYCIDRHWRDLRASGETEERLYGLDGWRESPRYSERERVALALCEAMTLVAGSPVPDPVWEAAAGTFPAHELAQILVVVGMINAWNRVLIAIRAEPGRDHPPALRPRVRAS